MKLSVKQQLFAKDLAKLLTYIFSQRYNVSIGEAQRTTDQQKIYVATGRSWTYLSQHLKKLAVDLFFFKLDGELTWSKKELQ